MEIVIKHIHKVKTRAAVPVAMPADCAYYVEDENITIYPNGDVEYGLPKRIEGAYIPYWLPDGKLAWRNTLGWENPDPVDLRGAKGDDGLGQIASVAAEALPYGAAPQVVNNGTTQTAELVFKIPEGKPGRDGRDGKDGKDGKDATADIAPIATTWAGWL